MTLHITAAQQAAIREGLNVLVVPGQWCFHLDDHPCHCAESPPADLVAATKPCWCSADDRLLKGKVWKHGPHADGSDGKYVRCPDCIDGRPRVELTMDCETCSGKGFKLSDYEAVARAFFAIEKDGRGAGLRHLRCPDCTNGKRVVGTVTVTAVVPVVAPDAAKAGGADPQPIVGKFAIVFDGVMWT